MANQIQCPGCTARFRVRLRNAAPQRVEVACPQCGTAIMFGQKRQRRALEQGPEPRRLTSTSPTNDRASKSSTTASKKTSNKRPNKTPEMDRRPDRPGWQTLDHSAVFGRTAPPPPTRSKPRPTTGGGPDLNPSQGPRLGLFESGDSTDSSPDPRIPEADRPGGSSAPLASALLRELKQRRKKAPSTSSPAPDTDSAPKASDQAETSTATATVSESTDDWIDDELISETIDAAADGLSTQEGSTFERLRGPTIDDEDDAGDQASTSIPEPTPPPTPASAGPEPPPTSEQTPEPEKAPQSEPEPAPEPEPASEPQPASEPEPETEPPPDPSLDPPIELTAVPTGSDSPESEPGAQSGFSDDIPVPDTTYKLRIGDRVYGDIGFEGLLSLFRRGIWVVADEISEDDGPWMPVEKHPIFDRVRHAIADGITGLLMTHGKLVTDGEDTDAQKKTDQSTPDPTPESTEPSRQPAVTKASVEPDEAVESTTLSSVIRSARATLPWTIALISTGVASAAVTYAFFAEPSPGAEPRADQSAVAAPAIVDDGRLDDRRQLQDQRRRRIADATGYASDLVSEAADIDAADLAQNALDRRQYRLARQLAADALPDSTDAGRIQQIFDLALTHDPNLERQLRTIEPDHDADSLRALGGGASVTLRFTDDGQNLYAYKVDRDAWRDGWRVEVAAYKLCTILPCDLDIPVNEPARISRADFDELYGRVDTSYQHRYADERFDELIWHQEPGPDGVERQYLYGTLKEWVNHYTKWPVEYVDTWKPWLDLQQDESVLDQDFEDYLQRLADYDRRFIDELRQETQATSTRQLARQMSNLHVFDYLTSNFDRHSGIEDFYGVNAHFADGRFVPIDNSAAFQRVERPVMDARLLHIGRFSRSLIDSIRLLRPEVVEPVLFPDADGREQIRLGIFWERRQKLLDYVDGLVEEHGEDAVYAFE